MPNVKRTVIPAANPPRIGRPSSARKMATTAPARRTSSDTTEAIFTDCSFIGNREDGLEVINSPVEEPGGNALVLGGSQGAQALNTIVPQALARVAEAVRARSPVGEPLAVVHLAGAGIGDKRWTDEYSALWASHVTRLKHRIERQSED